MSGRNPKTLGVWGPRGTRAIAAESYWKQPDKWNRAAALGLCRDCRGSGSLIGPDDKIIRCNECNGCGRVTPYRSRVFCASLADVFEGPETMPESAVGPVGQARDRLFDLIDKTPALDWLLVTKRPQNIRRYWRPTPGERGDAFGIRKNVWLLTSVEDQAAADERIPALIDAAAMGCPPFRVAPVLGLSVEPLIGPVDLTRHLHLLQCRRRIRTGGAGV